MTEQKRPMMGASAVAITAATGAVACAACFVLPFALPAAMLAGFGSVLAVFASADAWITPLAVIAIAGAWAWIGWRSLLSRAWPARSTIYVMGAASALTSIAIVWRQIQC